MIDRVWAPLEEQVKDNWEQQRCFYGMQQDILYGTRKGAPKYGHNWEWGGCTKIYMEGRRMPSERAPKQFLYYEYHPIGRRNPRRQRRRRLDI
jgi:hypothetical protein